jgi:hypothetical protein
VVPRPVDPDDLPLEFLRTPDEHEFASRMSGSAFAPTLVAAKSHATHATHAAQVAQGGLQGRPFRLRTLTGRVFRNS